MRSDPLQFSLANQSASRKPRFVIKIEFDVESIYCTSHDDVTGIPGVVLESVVQRPSAVSQRLYPDEGRTEIGSFTFQVVDKAAALTDELRSQLADNGQGIRGRPVEFWIGYAGFGFSAFQLFTTQIVVGCSYDKGLYTIKCADITREQRKEVFRPVSTTLTATIDAVAVTVPANDTSRFQTVAHGTSYSDAPSLTVGYIRIEDEIIRYTGTTGTSFTGCTRGVFNSRAVAHVIEANTPVSRRTKIEEIIYLEMPGPKLAYAVLTGVIYGTANTLPEHWHLGIDAALVRLADFETIGPDLWVPANDADLGPLTFRFDGLKAQDGKQFLEKQVFLLLACYSPIYSDGTIGLKRMVPVISTASPVVTLTENQIVSMSELEHDLDGMHNIFLIEWGHEEVRDDFIRDTLFVDEESIIVHGKSPVQKYQFYGLHSQRATDATLAKKLDAIRDRYAEPPQRLTTTVLGSLNRIEVGDIVGVRVPDQVLRDFTQEAGEYNRSFEVQQKSYDAFSGDVTLQIFGSTSRPSPLPIGTGETPPLPNAFYSSAGTALTSIISEASAGVLNTGSFTLTGNASLTAAGAVFYYLGDLTIPNGCNITIAANVQLRVMGFLTLNGTINGAGGGRAGVSDPGTGAWDAVFAGNSGFVGNSRGWDGVLAKVAPVGRVPAVNAQSLPAAMTRAQFASFPTLELTVQGTTLLGLPSELRGSGGAPGGRIVGRQANGTYSIVAAGGAGANGGAGLCVISRGMSMGASASITLDGNDSAATSLVTFSFIDFYPGVGGAGGPGAFLLLLDGVTLAVPEIMPTNFSARTGAFTQPGNPLPLPEVNGIGVVRGDGLSLVAPFCAYSDPAVINDQDYSGAARGLQFIPKDDDDAGSTPDFTPDAPTNLTANSTTGGNALTWTNPDPSQFDVVVVYASIDNDRTNAIEVGETRASTFIHPLPLGGRRYYWIRSRFDPSPVRPLRFSSFEPLSATAGVASNAATPGEIPEGPANFSATPRVNGIHFKWSLPWAKLMGLIEIYEYTASTPFTSATKVWEGYALNAFVPRTDTSTRYYWLVLNRNGAFSSPEPSLEGLPAAPLSATSSLTVNATPTPVQVTANLSPPDPKTITTPPTTAVVSGGSGPYTYLWTLPEPSNITINTPTAASTTFSSTSFLNGSFRAATATITVTDSLGATAHFDVTVAFYWPSIL
jgi:hypothetical protein